MNTCKSSTYQRALLRIASQFGFEKKRILVTGATGLIGSCLVDFFLLFDSLEVFALGRNTEKMKARFEGCKKNLHFIEQDITSGLSLSISFDYIIHVASNADPKSYALFPAETILTNIDGTKAVLDYCKYNKKTRVVFTSTFEVYGKHEIDNYSEDDVGILDFNQLRSCYPESKRVAEILFKAYGEEYNVDYVIARLCSIFGPTMTPNDSKAHAQFLRRAVNKESVVLKSKGDQKRTYLYVIDAVSALATILINGEKGGVYNVSSEESITTIFQIAHTIAEIAGVDVSFDNPDIIEKKGYSKPQNCILVSDKLRRLGWKARYSLYDGLKETIQILEEIKES